MIPVVRMMMLMMTTTTTVFKHAKVVNPYSQNCGNYSWRREMYDQGVPPCSDIPILEFYIGGPFLSDEIPYHAD